MIHTIAGLIVLAVFVGAAFVVAIGVICDPGPKDDYDGGAW
jgi:hypothetical protein